MVYIILHNDSALTVNLLWFQTVKINAHFSEFEFSFFFLIFDSVELNSLTCQMSFS